MRAAWRGRAPGCAYIGEKILEVVVHQEERHLLRRRHLPHDELLGERIGVLLGAPHCMDVAAGDYKIAAFRHPLRYGTVFPRFAQ